MAARARHWSAIDLTMLGRVHVAKSTMASTLVHVASFVAPPERQARALQDIIDGYIYGKPQDSSTDDRPLLFFWFTGGYMGVARCRAPACNLEG